MKSLTKSPARDDNASGKKFDFYWHRRKYARVRPGNIPTFALIRGVSKQSLKLWLEINTRIASNLFMYKLGQKFRAPLWFLLIRRIFSFGNDRIDWFGHSNLCWNDRNDSLRTNLFDSTLLVFLCAPNFWHIRLYELLFFIWIYEDFWTAWHAQALIGEASGSRRR